MKLIRLKDNLDAYHQRRANAHGWLYILQEGPTTVVRDYGRNESTLLVEARSVATGVVCTFLPSFVEEAPDAT